MGPPQSKGETFPVDKMKRAGQLREEVGLCPDYTCLILEVKGPPQRHMHRKPPWRSKRNDVKRCSTHRPFQ